MAFKAGAIFGEARLDTKKWSGPLKSLSTSTKIAMASVVAAISAAAVKSIADANKFQKSMSNVATIIDEAAISTQAFALELLRLDPALGSTTELTDALYQSISAGATDAESAMSTVVDAAKFSKAALTDTATAVDVLTTAVNAYGVENVSTTQASDIFFKTIQLGKITGDELASTIGASIPLFSSVGIELEELSSGLAAMTKQGVNAANATTQMNAIVTAFLTPSQAMSEALADIGFESGSAFLEAEGLAGALELLEDVTRGDAAEMSKLIPNVRGLRGAMALTGTGAQVFKDTLEEMATATGITDEAFDKQEKTFETYLNSAGKISIVLGNIGKSFVDDIAVGATQANEAMLNFILSAPFMEMVADTVAVTAGAFEGLKVIFTAIVDAVKPTITEVWGALTDEFKELFGESDLLSGATAVLSVVTQTIIGVIIVLATRIQAIIGTYGDWIKAIVETAKVSWSFIKMLAGQATWDEVKENARSAGDAFIALGLGVIDGYVDMFNVAKDQIKSFGADAEEINVDLQTNIQTGFKQTRDNVISGWDEMITGQADASDAMKANLISLTQTKEEESENQNDVVTQ